MEMQHPALVMNDHRYYLWKYVLEHLSFLVKIQLIFIAKWLISFACHCKKMGMEYCLKRSGNSSFKMAFSKIEK